MSEKQRIEEFKAITEILKYLFSLDKKYQKLIDFSKLIEYYDKIINQKLF
jgi:hypothetical protein